MRFARSFARLGLLLAAFSLTAGSSWGEVRLVQLTAANIDQQVSGAARGVLTPGDVLLKNEFLEVAILTSGTKNAPHRAGSCIILSAPGSVTKDMPVASLQPGPGSTWSHPEAGDNDNVGVVRLHREESYWGAELTYRLRSDSSWVDVITRVVNKHSDRVLEIPVVDELSPLDGGEIMGEGNSLVLISKSGTAASYFSMGASATVGEGHGIWNLGFVSGDPMPGVFRRVSARIISLGRSPQIVPLDAPRNWSRNVKDRETWYRIEPQKERVSVRRLVIGSSREQLAAIAPSAQGEGATMTSRAGDSVRINPAPKQGQPLPPVVAHLREAPPKVEEPTVTISPPPTANPVISGHLRRETEATLGTPRPLPAAATESDLPKPIAPEALPLPSGNPGSTPVAPSIEAIGDLPPPVE